MTVEKSIIANNMILKLESRFLRVALSAYTLDGNFLCPHYQFVKIVLNVESICLSISYLSGALYETQLVEFEH